MPTTHGTFSGILDGIMNGIAQIDKAGRIVVPKKLRDALHLTPGTRLRVERSGDTLVLEQDFPEVKLEMRDGLWVMTGGPPSDLEIPELIKQGYDERHKRIMEGSGLE
jgi:AbrB family looped-hinge helix DNA binding protein